LGIRKVEDFLYHIPSRYEDFSLISKIDKVQEGEVVTVQGIVSEIKNVFTKNHKKLQQAKITDDTGTINVIWFNQMYLTKMIHKGDFISLAGRVEKNKNLFSLYSPDYEIIDSEKKLTVHTGKIVPIYPETKGLSSKWIRRQIY